MTKTAAQRIAPATAGQATEEELVSRELDPEGDAGCEVQAPVPLP